MKGPLRESPGRLRTMAACNTITGEELRRLLWTAAVIPARGEHFGESGEVGFEVTVGRTAFLVGLVVVAVPEKPSLPVLTCIHTAHSTTRCRQ